jgi:hypothetical protein
LETGDVIFDSAGQDAISLDSTISLTSVAFFETSSGQLQFGYRTDVVTVNDANAIERIELSTGAYLEQTDLLALSEDIDDYATANSLTLSSLADVQQDTGLMELINDAWHVA